MGFEVNKFLTLTALLASAAATAVACSGSDVIEGSVGGGGSGSSGRGGSSGRSGSSGDAGRVQTSGGQSNSGAGENTGGVGGEGGVFAGGAPSEGGTPDGGAGEAGAAGTTVACIGDSVSSGCGLWSQALSDCSDESGWLITMACAQLQAYARPGVVSAFNDCIRAGHGECGGTVLSQCYASLTGHGCKQPFTATTCAAVATTCNDGTIVNCPALVNLTSANNMAAAIGCMDPASASFDATFNGTCNDRLYGCITQRR